MRIGTRRMQGGCAHISAPARFRRSLPERGRAGRSVLGTLVLSLLVAGCFGPPHDFTVDVYNNSGRAVSFSLKVSREGSDGPPLANLTTALPDGAFIEDVVREDANGRYEVSLRLDNGTSFLRVHNFSRTQGPWVKIFLQPTFVEYAPYIV